MKKIITSVLMLFTAVYTYGQVNGKLLVAAKMSGLQEVPVVSTPGTGVAGLFLTPGRDSLFINITMANLSGPITGIHIHEAPEGVNGGVVKDLMPYLKGTHISAVLTGADVNASFIAKLLAGRFYVNAHTAANPNGEIRGQLKLESEYAFWGTLEGSQEVPSTGSTATGWVAASLSHDKSMVNVWAVWRGLTGPATSAHFHAAPAGSNGSVVLDLSSQISGNTIVATMPAGAIANDLLAGNIYLNVHTAAFPNGEIRAQMMMSDKLNFVAWIDAGQEVPPTSAVGKGLAFIRVNTTMDSIWYNILVDSLSGPITGAHFHDGVRGFSGNVIINIGSGVNGNIISGVATGTAAGVTMANINKMMMGQTYINVHTAANASGEVRGQVMPMARTGFIVVFNGKQIAPTPIHTGAVGSGIISVDPLASNIHYMFVLNGLSGPVTTAYIANAAVGFNGTQVVDISSRFAKTGTSDSASGYITGLSQANILELMNGRMYVIINTAANPTGEIRGQVTNEGVVYVSTASIWNPVYTPVNVFPNPAIASLYVADETADGEVAVKVTDIQGREVINYTAEVNAGEGIHVNVDGLSRGMYILHIQSGDVIKTARFTKQ